MGKCRVPFTGWNPAQVTPVALVNCNKQNSSSCQYLLSPLMKGNLFINDLTPTQEHFLKKYLLENRLSHELHELNKPQCCEILGPPFKVRQSASINGSGTSSDQSLPLLSFFFSNFVATFPFVTLNPESDQIDFWQNTVQPFIESFNTKNISDSEDRHENITKRRQVNKKFLSGLLLFYNSMIITNKDLTYLKESHLKPSDTGNMEKLHSSTKNVPHSFQTDLNDFKKMKYFNDIAINVVAVRTLESESTSSWNPFRYVSELVPRHHYEFVIQVVRREKKETSDFVYACHFVSRAYGEFRKLETKLKHEYPGLMTDIPELPLKSKNDDGFLELESDSLLPPSNMSKKSLERNLTSSLENLGPKSTAMLTSTFLEKTSVAPSQEMKFVREKLRLALRGYLNTLIRYPEIVHCDIFKLFSNSNSFSQLSPTDVVDYEARVKYEEIKLQTQYEFQQQTTKAIVKLQHDFEDFKQKLVMDPKTVTILFEDIGKSSNIHDLSPLLQTFNEWCKLEVAATLYQIFLNQDNSSEWLNKCKKLHRLFPYNLIYGILKFTNPLKIVSRVIDLLLVNIPRFSWPKWSKGEELEEPPKTQAHNFLSMIFIMLLNEDLNGFEKEIKLLANDKLGSGYDTFLQRLRNYPELSYMTIGEIKQESLSKGEELFITVLKSDKIEPKLKDSDKDILQQVIVSQKAYQDIGSQLAGSNLYLNLKQYWQLHVRKKDKDLIKQLWTEPELTKLIKNFLTIFYQPIIKIFNKADIHLIFKDSQRFVDDLVEKLDQLNNEEVYYLNSVEIFDELKRVLDKHENLIWKFMYSVYKNDEQQLFYKLISWLESFLSMLRLKFSNAGTVTLDLAVPTEEPIDEELFIEQLNSRIDKIVSKRRLFKEYLNKKAESNNVSHQDKIDGDWEKVNDQVFGNMSMGDFGVASDDVEEFNYLNAEEDFLHDDGQGNLEKELKQKLYEFEQSGQNWGTSELDKLDGIVTKQMESLLLDIKINR